MTSGSNQAISMTFGNLSTVIHIIGFDYRTINIRETCYIPTKAWISTTN